MPDLKKIEAAISNLDKLFGKNSVMLLGKHSAMKVGVIPTGILSFDKASGVGGVPRGRVTEIFGPESSGKTTVALQLIAQAQALGGAAAFIDAEHALDPTYATNLGVNVPALYFSQPNCGEDALEIVEGLVTCGELDIVVVDSVAALVPRAELEGQMGDSQMGLQARLMSQAMRKLAGVVCRTKTCLVFINQIRDKIGVMYGSPETTTGGRALKFYASMRLDVRRVTQIKDGDKIIGAETKIKFVKNKVATPLTEAKIELYYGKGFSQLADLINLGVDCGVINKAGAWYDYAGERLGQGKDNVMETLTTNTALAQKIFSEVRSKIFPVVEEK